MSIHYYLSLSPTEALIASELEPVQFGAYMATGSKKGSAEQIIFIELTGEFGDYFDWNYAREKCTPHDNGDPKHSIYLSIYRTLENVPMEYMGNLYLTTRDGRSFPLEKTAYAENTAKPDFHVYHEICPVRPVIVSKLSAKDFGKNITDKKNKVNVPKIAFADLKIPNLSNDKDTGNIGHTYDNKRAHLLACIASVSSKEGKNNKTLDRAEAAGFMFQVIGKGIFIADDSEIIMYPMPDIEEIKQKDYDWGRSALIL